MRISRCGDRIALFACNGREALYLRKLSIVLPQSQSPEVSVYVDQFDSAPFGLVGLPRHKKGETAVLVVGSRFFTS
jgi:hypothetical protein